MLSVLAAKAARRSARRFLRQIASDSSPMVVLGKTTPAGCSLTQSGSALHSSRQVLLFNLRVPTAGYTNSSLASERVCAPLSVKRDPFFERKTQGFSSSAHAFAEAALDREEVAEEAHHKQFLDLEGDDDLPEGSLEDEFEEEKGRRSLASLFGSDEDDYVEVDAALQDESLLVENCGLSEQTVKALHVRGVKSLFPIQKHVFDPAMSGRDLIGRAKTGSGKTLAFSLPVIEYLRKALVKEAEEAGRLPRGRAPRCIVLAPTRELAKQVEREFAASAPGLSVGCFYGGVSIENQIRDLRKGMDVVVGTPGRVIDLLERKNLNLGQIKFVILDEADMMLSQGFDEDVERILEEVPEERQTMLFSATMPGWVKRLTRQHLTQPIMVDLVGEASSGRLNEDITALAVQVEPSMRRSVLVDVLTVHGAGKSIVFTQTKRDADEVAAGVSQAIPCEALHGDMSQRDRERRLDNFRKGKFAVLVATDVAARGLDIPNVDLVLHYELPKDVESFLHRSGRTARAGKTGTTIALFTRMETGMLRRIIKQVGVKNLEIMAPPGPRQVMEASAKQVLRRLDVIDEDVKAFFQPAAQLVMAESDPEDALCRALAALSGLLEVPKPRSLLTQQEGYVTLRIASRPGRIKSTGHIMTIVRNVLGEAACDEVGRIRLLREAESQGAAFDLPEELAKQMQENQAELTSREFALDVPKSLPLEEEQSSLRHGRASGGRGSPRGGYGSGFGGNRRQSGRGRGGGRGADRGGGSYGGGGGRSFGGRGNGRDNGGRKYQQNGSRGSYGGPSRGSYGRNYSSW